jgi:hypothetical protein
MGLECDDDQSAAIRHTVVIPILRLLEQQAVIPYSGRGFHLVMGTIAQESLMCTYLVQQMDPALGIGQIEPNSLALLVAALNPKEAAALASVATPASPAHNVVAQPALCSRDHPVVLPHDPGGAADRRHRGGALRVLQAVVQYPDRGGDPGAIRAELGPDRQSLCR